MYGEPYRSDALYVANSDSKGVSLINSATNEVVGALKFDILPSKVGEVRPGSIVCNGIETPLKQFFYISSGSKCTAKPDKGFEFSSWVETLGSNLTNTITATQGSPLTVFLDTINMKPDDPAATLTVNRFGNFTAYFKAIPPALPADYWASLFTVVATALIGSLVIPASVQWFKLRSQTSRLNSYHQEMNSLQKDGLDEKEINDLNIIHRNISNEYSKGNINNEQFTNLKKEVSVLHYEKFKSEINTSMESSKKDSTIQNQSERINKNVVDAYSKDRINNEHYSDIKNEISSAYKRIFNERINVLLDQSDNVTKRKKILDTIRENITEAYSDNKITRLHYDLLNEKISKVTNEGSNDDPLQKK